MRAAQGSQAKRNKTRQKAEPLLPVWSSFSDCVQILYALLPHLELYAPAPGSRRTPHSPGKFTLTPHAPTLGQGAEGPPEAASCHAAQS